MLRVVVHCSCLWASSQARTAGSLLPDSATASSSWPPLPLELRQSEQTQQCLAYCQQSIARRPRAIAEICHRSDCRGCGFCQNGQDKMRAAGSSAAPTSAPDLGSRSGCTSDGSSDCSSCEGQPSNSLNCSDERCWPLKPVTQTFCSLAQTGRAYPMDVETTLLPKSWPNGLYSQSCSLSGYSTLRNWFYDPRDVISLPTDVLYTDIAQLFDALSCDEAQRVLGNVAQCGIERLMMEETPDSLKGKYIYTCFHGPASLKYQWLHSHTFVSTIDLYSPEARPLAANVLSASDMDYYARWVIEEPYRFHCNGFVHSGADGPASFSKANFTRAILASPREWDDNCQASPTPKNI